ncbi:hypothetical protein B0T22DRAFT_540324 [Podospora appendiculata]|uniref:Uncharacterized protein n=1 Tax=Podospora appendiculata TaxID=314037 RepID=A0AAE1C728_9PEZI|nr:hypothetical protein B0T22DRAFT_540324 [Podospora appendiculata]
MLEPQQLLWLQVAAVSCYVLMNAVSITYMVRLYLRPPLRTRLRAHRNAGTPQLDPTVYCCHPRTFTFSWVAHDVFICIVDLGLFVPGVLLASEKFKGAAVVIAVYGTLWDRTHWLRLWPQRWKWARWVYFSAVVIAQLGLIGAVLLPIGTARKYIVCAVVSIVYLWSICENVVVIRGTRKSPHAWKQLRVQWFCLLIATAMSTVGCWVMVAVQPLPFEEYLLSMLFICLPVQLVWYGCFLRSPHYNLPLSRPDNEHGSSGGSELELVKRRTAETNRRPSKRPGTNEPRDLKAVHR